MESVEKTERFSLRALCAFLADFFGDGSGDAFVVMELHGEGGATLRP